MGAGDGGEQYVASHSEQALWIALKNAVQQFVWAAEHTLHTLVSALQMAITVGVAVGADVAEMDPTSAQMHNSRLFTGPIPPGMLVGIRSCAKQAAADQVSYF